MRLLSGPRPSTMAASLVVRQAARHRRCRGPGVFAASLRVASFSVSTPLASSSSRRSPSFDTSFASSYDPDQDTARGPIYTRGNAYGDPRFYPRDLKKTVDDYVVGQDRAKKIICSFLFNHYRGIQRRRHDERQDQRLREKRDRQKHRDAHERAGGEYAASTQRGDAAGNSNDTATDGGGPHRTQVLEGLDTGTATDESLHRNDHYRHAASMSVAGHAFEDDFYRRAELVRSSYQQLDEPDDALDTFLLDRDAAIPRRVKIDKSNLLLIGPTGVGKTYILE